MTKVHQQTKDFQVTNEHESFPTLEKLAFKVLWSHRKDNNLFPEQPYDVTMIHQFYKDLSNKYCNLWKLSCKLKYLNRLHIYYSHSKQYKEAKEIDLFFHNMKDIIDNNFEFNESKEEVQDRLSVAHKMIYFNRSLRHEFNHPNIIKNISFDNLNYKTLVNFENQNLRIRYKIIAYNIVYGFFTSVSELCMKKYKSVTLTQNQKIHLRKALDILSKANGFVDISETGSGKSYIAMEIAMKLKFDVLVICVASARLTWKEYLTEHFINSYQIISYSSIIHCNDKNNIVKLRLGTKYYHVTDELIERMKKGLFIIFDESHLIKNRQTKCQQACIAICRSLIPPSKLCLISSTVSCSEDVTYIMKCLNIQKHPVLADYKKREAKGFEEICREALRLDRKTALDILNPYGITTFYCPQTDAFYPIRMNAATAIVFQLTSQILKYHYFSYMESYNRNMANIQNVLIIVSNADQAIIDSNIQEVQNKIAILRATRQDYQYSMIYFQTEMKSNETVKLKYFFYLMKKDLENDPDCKVVCCLNYKINQVKLMQMFVEDGVHTPYSIFAKDSEEIRKQTQDFFQKHSSECNVLILSCKIASTSINLDDTDSNKSRIRQVYISPNYEFIGQQQLIGRFARKNTKSIANINFVYCNTDREQSLRDTTKSDHVNSKAANLRALLLYETKFNGDYPDVVLDTSHVDDMW